MIHFSYGSYSRMDLSKLWYKRLFKHMLIKCSPIFLVDITHYWDYIFYKALTELSFPVPYYRDPWLYGTMVFIAKYLSIYVEISSFRKPSNMMHTITQEHQYDIIYRMTHDKEETNDLQRNLYTYSHGGYKGGGCTKLV